MKKTYVYHTFAQLVLYITGTAHHKRLHAAKSLSLQPCQGIAWHFSADTSGLAQKSQRILAGEKMQTVHTDSRRGGDRFFVFDKDEFLS